MDKEMMETCTDFLLAHNGPATATALATVSGGERSHDQVTRFLSGQDYTSKELWRRVKPAVRRVESDGGCLIFDDTIQEKEWTDENEVICWHFDHVQNRAVKGINLLNALYHAQGVTLPVAFELIKKPEVFYDQAAGKLKRRATVTKNEHMRAMITACAGNQLRFRYVLMDSLFCANENLCFIVEKKRHFIAAMKGNRLVALSLEDKRKGRFQAISALE
ncbi:MAG: transposase, partial [Opitutaceae bacterium]|nr:transposase [Opitutaceae bacterium]